VSADAAGRSTPNRFDNTLDLPADVAPTATISGSRSRTAVLHGVKDVAVVAAGPSSRVDDEGEDSNASSRSRPPILVPRSGGAARCPSSAIVLAVFIVIVLADEAAEGKENDGTNGLGLKYKRLLPSSLLS